jgi:hypothetical protein
LPRKATVGFVGVQKVVVTVGIKIIEYMSIFPGSLVEKELGSRSSDYRRRRKSRGEVVL